jgi:3-deoxy-D-manno-octulosonic-acid transferase
MFTLLDAFYILALIVTSPLVLLKLMTNVRFRAGLLRRFGALPPEMRKAVAALPQRPLWIHCPSVGEVNATRTFIEEWQKRCPDRPFVISTFTNTGYHEARKKYGAERAFILPLDFSWVARKVIRRIRPCCLALVELELWPNTLRQLHRAGIPAVVVNGRIRERSVKGLRRLRWLAGSDFIGVTPNLFSAQTESYAERFRRIGAPPEHVRVTGSMKFDAVQVRVDGEKRARLRWDLGLTEGAPLFVAGSTWAGEEKIVLAVYWRLLREHPSLRLLIAPKHIERAEEVEGVIREAGFQCRRRSATAKDIDTSATTKDNSVLLLDTIGELVAAYSLASVAFVGRSLVPGGGQNMLEPVALGVPVLFGPHTDNFPSETDLLLAGGGAWLVRDGESLYAGVHGLLADPAKRQSLVAAAQEVIAQNRGATGRNIEAVMELLGR